MFEYVFKLCFCLFHFTFWHKSFYLCRLESSRLPDSPAASWVLNIETGASTHGLTLCNVQITLNISISPTFTIHGLKHSKFILLSFKHPSLICNHILHNISYSHLIEVWCHWSKPCSSPPFPVYYLVLGNSFLCHLHMHKEILWYLFPMLGLLHFLKRSAIAFVLLQMTQCHSFGVYFIMHMYYILNCCNWV